MKAIRLDKYLAGAGTLSRSQVKDLVKKGRVTVDGITEKRPERKVDPEKNRVCLDGRDCLYEEYLYLMLNKPGGVISATEDARERTVLDLVDTGGHKLFPVGRLDRDTEGLLLLTDDGRLAHELLSPGKHVDKTYYALLDEEVSDHESRLFQEGLDIGDEKKTLPARLRPLGQEEGGFAVRIIIQEGRFHQIKRMAHAIGRKVLFLRRESMGPLTLDSGLQPGQYRKLTPEEIDKLKNRDI